MENKEIERLGQSGEKNSCQSNSHDKHELGLLCSYFDEDPHIYAYGDLEDVESKLDALLPALQQCDRPDMYAIVGNTLVILEHFAFDASRETSKKGIERIRKEREAHAKMWEYASQGNIPSENVVKVGAELSSRVWQGNFEKHFDSHYSKIGRYFENAAKKAVAKGLVSKTESITNYRTGFFIEEEFPPFMELKGDLRRVRYAETKQFLDFYSTRPMVDFILYGTLLGEKRCVYYIDHSHTISREKAFDLGDENLKMANNMNRNERISSFLVAF